MTQSTTELLRAASHALRSYQYGNSATDLAASIADRIDAALAQPQPEPIAFMVKGSFTELFTDLEQASKYAMTIGADVTSLYDRPAQPQQPPGWLPIAPEGWQLVPAMMTAAMVNAWAGGIAVSSDEIAYRTPFQDGWSRVLAAAPAHTSPPSRPYGGDPAEPRDDSDRGEQQEGGEAAMLDWLESQINQHGAIHLHDGNHHSGHGLGLRPGSMVRTLREAIDAAMKGGGYE